MHKKIISKIFKIHWTKYLSIFFLILLFGAYTNIFAIGQKYTPGETLDPTCPPGEVNCTVEVGSGGAWGLITGTLSNQTDLLDILNDKQDTLFSGTNIKTLNGDSILGGGNLTITALPAGGDSAIQFNNSNAFAGDENNFAWDNVNKRFFIGSGITNIAYDNTAYGQLNILAPNPSGGGTTFTTDSSEVTGLNDATFSGTYISTYNDTTYPYTIFASGIISPGTPDQIMLIEMHCDSAPSNTSQPNCDEDNAVMLQAVITGSPQTIADGISVTFGATTGHTNGDGWIYAGHDIINSFPVINVVRDDSTSLFVVDQNGNANIGGSATVTGSVGIGVVFPTARLNLPAGIATAGTAPLKFTAGTNLTTTEAGAVEYDGTHLYFTATNGGTRYQLDQQGGGGLLSDADFNTKGGTNAGANYVAGAQGNTFLGYEAGKGGVVTNQADNNTAIGYQSLYSNITGFQNTANGYQSLFSNTTGFYNTANGNYSLYSNTEGYQNTANGVQSLYSNTTGNYNTANGSGSLYSNTTGSSNTANGFQSLFSNTTGDGNTANGLASLYLNTTGQRNTANGSGSLYSNTTGQRNTANGYNSISFNTTGWGNTANGHSSLSYNTTGNYNTANGYDSLSNSGKTITAGSFISGISYTIYSTGSTDYTLIGATDSNPGTVFTATGVGSGTGKASSNTNNNTALGYQSGMYIGAGYTNNTASSNSLYLGYDTRALADGDSNEIVIGYGTIGNGTNTATLGSTNVLYVGGNTISGKVARFTSSTGYCDVDPLNVGLSCSSDFTLKKHITTLDNVDYTLPTTPTETASTLDKIIALTPVTYNWNIEKDTDSKHIGFIAQEMEMYFPDLVSTDSTTKLKSIAYGNLTPYLVKAMQEIDLKVKDLSSLDTTSATSLGSLMKSFLGDQVILIGELKTNLLRINGDVCVDDVCITKEEFKNMLLKAKQSQVDILDISEVNNVDSNADENSVVEENKIGTIVPEISQNEGVNQELPQEQGITDTNVENEEKTSAIVETLPSID